jgi:hypothetical protein
MSRLCAFPLVFASGQTLIPQRLTARHDRYMDTETLAALRQQAQARVNFIRWIAQRLEQPDDSPEIRRQAAQILRQLLEDAQA